MTSFSNWQCEKMKVWECDSLKEHKLESLIIWKSESVIQLLEYGNPPCPLSNHSTHRGHSNVLKVAHLWSSFMKIMISFLLHNSTLIFTLKVLPQGRRRPRIWSRQLCSTVHLWHQRWILRHILGSTLCTVHLWNQCWILKHILGSRTYMFKCTVNRIFDRANPDYGNTRCQFFLRV